MVTYSILIFVDRNYARDEEVQEELWAYSEKLANDKPNA